MAVLDTVYVIQETSTMTDSETDASFELLIPATGKVDPLDGFLRKKFPRQKHDNREKGRADYYEFDVKGLGVDHKQARGKFKIEIKGSDAWRPSSIWILGRLRNGQYRILGACPRWPSGSTFSTKASKGKRSHVVPIS